MLYQRAADLQPVLFVLWLHLWAHILVTKESALVKNWFATHFDRLHPMIQELHTAGGRLSGDVEISYGSGLAGIVGARLAKKMSLPDAGKHHLCVDISHSDNALVWSRSFDGAAPVVSLFEPVGTLDDGYWFEKTGAVTLQLTVKIIDAGWHWQCQKISIANIPLPLRLIPASHAYKSIEDGRYRFAVKFSYPLLGSLVSYRGLLDPEPAR